MLWDYKNKFYGQISQTHGCFHPETFENQLVNFKSDILLPLLSLYLACETK